GNADERVKLFRAALQQAGGDAARRKDLLHTIASLERVELANQAGAIEAYRTALDGDPGDRTAYLALVDLYEETLAWDDLCDLLEAHIAQCSGAELLETRA